MTIILEHHAAAPSEPLTATQHRASQIGSSEIIEDEIQVDWGDDGGSGFPPPRLPPVDDRRPRRWGEGKRHGRLAKALYMLLVFLLSFMVWAMIGAAARPMWTTLTGEQW